MPRKLKTYTTSIGFYDLAVAAPSMKAALEAWGSRQNLFHLGLAEESDDAATMAATMAKPGAVLRRAVGTDASFQEHAALPKSLPASAPRREANPRSKPAKKAKVSSKTPKAAIIQFEKERAKREKLREQEEAERQRQKAVQARDDACRQRFVGKAQEALERARERHEAKLKQLQQERAALEGRIDMERDRWKQEEAKLDIAVQKAAK